MTQKISQQFSLPIRKDKIVGADPIDFYDYLRNLLINLDWTLKQIISAINAPPAYAHFYRNTVLDTSANGGADTWINVPFDDSGPENKGLVLQDNSYDIKAKVGGVYVGAYAFNCKNNKGNSVKATIGGRIMSGGSEVRTSTIAEYVTKEDGADIPLEVGMFLFRVYEGDLIKLQWRSGHEDVDLETNGFFDTSHTASISLFQLESK